MNLSIIMAYKPDGKIRDRHCKWTTARYREMFPSAEIIISKDSNTKPGWDTFCKAKYINAGVERAKNNNILITDIDVVFMKNTILKGMRLLKTHCAILPFSSIFYLSEQTTLNILLTPPLWQMPKVALKHEKKKVRVGIKPNGMHLLTKSAWKLSGGYDERYIGWGSEDSAFLISLITMIDQPIHRIYANCYHLWHPLDSARHKKRDARVSVLAKRYRQARGKPEEMAKIINEEGRR